MIFIRDEQLIKGLYHGGETYYGLNQRLKAKASDALTAIEGGAQ